MYKVKHLAKTLLGLFLLCGGHFLSAQSMVENYVEEGFRNNLLLQEKKVAIEKGILALKEAQSYFLPSANFIANYTLAAGGRVIDFPVGDLFNPIYATLNHLTASDRFPQVANQEILLAPNNFYDARVRISYPLLNPSLQFNKLLKTQAISLEEYELDIYRQELRRDIQVAYFNYCTAVEALGIYVSAAELVAQSKRNTESLLRNGKAVPANLRRVEAEAEQIHALWIETENKRRNAKYYLNFLLNRDQNDSVYHQAVALPPDAALLPADAGNRAELLKLSTAQSMQENVLKLNRKYAVPRVNSFIDLGSQAFEWQFDKRSRYYLLGFQIDMPVFNGQRNLFKIQESQLALQQLDQQQSRVSQQLNLAAKVAYNNLRTSKASLSSAERRLAAARAYHELIEKSYREGISALIELIDAQNQLTTAAIQVKVQHYKVLSDWAVWQRELAFPIN